MLHPSHSQYEPQNMYCRGKGVWVGGVTHFENSEVSMVALIKISRKSRRFRSTSLNKPNRKSTDTWRSCTCTRQDALTHTTHNTHGTRNPTNIHHNGEWSQVTLQRSETAQKGKQHTAASMYLVDNHDRVLAQQWIACKLPQQNAFGEEHTACGLVPRGAQANLVAACTTRRQATSNHASWNRTNRKADATQRNAMQRNAT